mgnify:CR=1 FL=1
MAQSLKCPSCGAPLEIENEFAQIVECEFCGVSSRLNLSSSNVFFGGADLLEQARKLKEIKQMAISNNKISAIKLFQETFGVGLSEALKAVENIIAGKPVTFTSVQTNFSTPQQNFGSIGEAIRQAGKIAEIQNEIRRGNKINAIKMYREAFGCSLAQAKEAVDALERGESVRLPSSAQIQTNHTIETSYGVAETKNGFSLFKIPPLITALIVVISLAVVWLIMNIVSRKTDDDSAVGVSKTAEQSEKPQFAKEILRLGGEGIGAGMFTDNRNVAVDSGGKIYSVDYTGGRVQVFDGAGKFLTQWFIDEKFGVFALEVSRDGRIYIIQRGEISVYKAEDGTFIKKSEMSFFRDIAIGLDDNLTAIDSSGTIHRLDRDLNSLAVFKDAAKSAGIDKLEYIAVNGPGEIFALSRNGKDVVKFSRDGKFADRFKIKADSPKDIAVDPKGRVFISDVNRIYVYTAEGEFVNDFETRQSFGMTFNDQGDLFVASRPFVVKYRLEN